jgi:hypothetical protein
LHAVWPAPHAASHACDVVLHEVPLGQSAATVQLQRPALHTWPAFDMVQLAQKPAAPHAVSLVPTLHMPPAQQPTLHRRLGLQVVAQVCVAVLHACPDGQSAALLQPQPLPPRQR